MRLIGITGGVGMGKSTAASWLRDQGLPLVDTDDLAREVVTPGSPGLAEVVAVFGAGILLDDGSLDRPALASRVFSEPEDRRRLEAILHPRIHALWQAAAGRWRGEAEAVGFVVIPLLFEKGYAGEFDATVTVACTRTSQRRRLQDRGWTDAQLAGRLAAQLPVEEKIGLASQVVWTEGSRQAHYRQWRRLLDLGL